jgi:predicted regulator of Ras-like GTPase activity (Roadblock/LC7/MglB family)
VRAILPGSEGPQATTWVACGLDGAVDVRRLRTRGIAGLDARRHGDTLPAHQRRAFAAIASSLTALGATALRELGAGVLDHVVVEGVQGKLVLVRLPELSGLMILAVQASADTRLGLVLGQARSCAVALGEVLRQAGAPAPAGA